jgi:hypothetical protein
VLAFLHFPQEHWRKVWSTNVVGIFPNDAAIVRLVGRQLLEQQEEWQLERQRFFSEATMAKIPEPEKPLWISPLATRLIQSLLSRAKAVSSSRRITPGIVDRRVAHSAIRVHRH